MAVLFFQRLLEQLVRSGIEAVENAGALTAQVDVEPRSLRNGIESRAAAQSHDGVRRARCALWGVISQRRHGTADGVRGISDTERGPGMTTRAMIGDAIAS